MTEYTTSRTLRVLLISVVEEARFEVEDALSGWGADHQLYWVSQPELAASRAQDLVPHVILVDGALGGAQAISLIRDLTVRVPTAATLAIVGEQAVDQARQAVLAGARGFLTRPLRADELATTLRQMLAPRRGARTEAEDAETTAGRVVVFCAPKGGTGRTTLALNTAISLLEETKEPVVLVDADYSAPALDVALNLHGERTIVDLLPRVSRLDRDLISGVLAKHASGLQVLLAPPPADLSNPISLPQVQHMMVVLKRMFPWVLVDLGLPLDEMAFAFADSADRIIMSVLPEMVGLRNTRLMLDQLHARGYPDGKICLVLNRATLRAGVSRHDIEERLGMKVAHRIPDDQPLATHSINRGVPLIISHRHSAVGRAVRRLARHLKDGLRCEELADSAGQKARRLLPRARSVGS